MMQSKVESFAPVEKDEPITWTVTLKITNRNDLQWLSEMIKQGVRVCNPCSLPDGGISSQSMILSSELNQAYRYSFRYD